jgi:alpha-ketoglutarate-dependent taurine dioxygenase
MQPLQQGDPRLLEGRGPGDLDVAGTVATLRRHGFVLLRGFAHSASDFEVITRQFSRRFMVHGNINREFVSQDGSTQAVDAGLHPLPLHSEMSYGPFYPDSMWFFCAVPPRVGGETTVCDGVALFNALAPESRSYFKTHRLRYRHRYPPRAWQQGIKTTARGLASLKLAIGARLYRKRGVYRFHFDHEQYLCVDYVTSALVPLRDGRHAFANSLEISYLPQVIALRGGSVTLENGEPVSGALLADVARAADAAGLRIGWQAGDVVMLDNARVMHGRVALSPDDRKILVRLGFRKRSYRTALY